MSSVSPKIASLFWAQLLQVTLVTLRLPVNPTTTYIGTPVWQ